jgi:hypothetical protein
MAVSQRAMTDMHNCMQRLELRGNDPTGAQALLAREQFLLNANWPVDRPVYGEGAGASGAAADDDDDDDDDDDVDDEATGSEAGSEEDSEPLEG